MSDIACDIAIFGGGVAGLWLLNQLSQKGYRVVLLESAQLGAGQTLKSQGIIHGGLKYSLQGTVHASTQSLLSIPDYWKRCFSGEGTLDLSSVKILSWVQALWTHKSFKNQLAQLFASRLMRSQVQRLDKKDYPQPLQHPNFRGQVYQLNEPVIDTHSLLSTLVRAVPSHTLWLYNADTLHFTQSSDHAVSSVELSAPTGQRITLRAQRYVFTAGTGNHTLLNHFIQTPLTQTRPLHMVLAKFKQPHILYGHHTSTQMNPDLTITTHFHSDGEVIWYLGGQLAETGIKYSQPEQIARAQQQLKVQLPWIDLTSAKWRTLRVKRAEPENQGKRPNQATYQCHHNVIAAWPVKLALAPQLSQTILNELERQSIYPSTPQQPWPHDWPCPPLAPPIWEELFAC